MTSSIGADTSHTGSKTLPTPAVIGRWLFERRTWVPLPFVLLLLIINPTHAVFVQVGTRLGPLLVVFGEALRLWAVRHIGVISRTRTDRLGPLVTTGPFALVRNPIYVANMLVWTGLACWSGEILLVPVCWILFGSLYYFIARWEAYVLESRYPLAYREYVQRVPAWLSIRCQWDRVLAPAPHAWRDTLFSERGTLIAIAIIAIALSLKNAW